MVSDARTVRWSGRTFSPENPSYRENLAALRNFLDTTDLSIRQIAARFGNTSHTGVLNAMTQMQPPYDYKKRERRLARERAQRIEEQRWQHMLKRLPLAYWIIVDACRRERVSFEPCVATPRDRRYWRIKPHAATINGHAVHLGYTYTLTRTSPQAIVRYAVCDVPDDILAYAFHLNATCLGEFSLIHIMHADDVRTHAGKSVNLPVDKKVQSSSGKELPSWSPYLSSIEAWDLLRDPPATQAAAPT